jgi:hypothetical protein
MTPADDHPYLNGMMKQMADGHHDDPPGFGFGFDLILDGLERLIETT